MADPVRSLVVKDGTTQQIPNADTLLVGVGIKPSVGGVGSTLSIGDADTTVDIPGDLDIQGALTVVGSSEFQQNATFLGNVSFGDTTSPVDDTVSFANATINSNINFDLVSGLPSYNITNLKDPSNAQDAATKNFVVNNTVASFSGGTTGLTPSTASTGAVTLAGTLGVTNGGTGQTTASAAFGALSPLTTKGDLLGYDTANARIPVGTNGQVLTADSAAALGLKWETPVTGLTVGTTAIANGAVNRVLFEGTGSVLQESANLTFDGSVLAVTGDVTVSANLKANGELWIDGEATLPLGATGYGKLAVKDGDGALYFVDATGQAHYTMPDGLLALSGATQTLDFDPELPSFRDLPLSGNTTFSTDSASLVAGRSMSIRLDNSAGGSARLLTFPNTAGVQKWTWLGGSPPAQVDAGDVAVISLMCYGTTDESIVAAWSYSESVQITGLGAAGQVAYFDGTRTIKSEGGLTWDETHDRLIIGSALNPNDANLRVGGSAHISGAVIFDGNVTLGDASGDAITVNGAMSLASGASFSGVSGTVTLPTQFSIGTGNAVSANVTAANLNTLTGGSDASSLHSHKANAIDGLTTTGTAAGDVVYVDTNDTVLKGDPTNINKSFILGVVTAAGVVATSGRVAAKFAASLSPAPAAGKPCYLAADGKLTTVAPTSGVIADVGIVLNASLYSTAGTCEISLAIKPTVQLV